MHEWVTKEEQGMWYIWEPKCRMTNYNVFLNQLVMNRLTIQHVNLVTI